MVSHDLRTPLASIMGSTELLALGVPDTLGEGGLKHVDRIQASGKHLLYLIEQLTDFARLDSEKSLALAEVHPLEVVRDVIDLVGPLAHERGLDLQVAEDGPIERMLTDAGKLRQILVNLAGNAIKFTTRGGVTVRVSRSDCGVAFQVCDTGVGIDPQHVESIFQPFWQAPTARNGDGAGLGLSIVRRLTARLGGDVQVRSTPGVGSTFTVSLPLCVSRSAPGGA
jgi:signal transduction histidine kinase